MMVCFHVMPARFLPPTNKIWDQVMFLQVSVCLSVNRGVSVWCHFLSGCLPGVSVSGAMFLPMVPCPWQRPPWHRPPWQGPTLQWRADGTHPTEMHYCCVINSIPVLHFGCSKTHGNEQPKMIHLDARTFRKTCIYFWRIYTFNFRKFWREDIAKNPYH